MEVKVEAQQVVDKIGKAVGTGGYVSIPKQWIGKKIKVLLIESID